MVLEGWNRGWHRPLRARHVFSCSSLGSGSRTGWRAVARRRSPGSPSSLPCSPASSCHELGHALTARRLRHSHPRYHPAAHRWRVPTERIPDDPRQEVWVSLAARRECGPSRAACTPGSLLSQTLAPVLRAHHGRRSVPRADPAGDVSLGSSPAPRLLARIVRYALESGHATMGSRVISRVRMP